ncbi:hypothetical protein D3P96_03040 [Weissella viridescens]|uniref:Uncharacterized protein n=1 Tax=Weissella viridescens TaxID=1629 RepID=A0A3P2RFK6_WEIVI|nr:hypothetical protein [Weissella viridescens]RRG18275.1 hypothetical protein D3P96_03040 [Weissella viridescens]
MHLSIQTIYMVVTGANMIFLILCALGIYRGIRDHDRYLVIVYLLLTLGIIIAVKLTLQATGILN